MPNGTPQKEQILQKALDALGQIIDDVTTLEVVTVIGKIERKPAGSGNQRVAYEPDPNQNPQYIVSKINLVDGDITQMIDRNLMSAEHQWVRDLHKEREEKGYQIIRDNVAAIKELVEAVADIEIG